ncbi:hypothetical protein C4D60_Mb04t10010 [Musa balbisiana]|uniref:Uncharacterized protein n=1 Tax=Musa balbisiana TaxID=52838 RepID=A0A4S8KAY5_MUSBA|nr:hypothetical protein C4D60_Mb04t10010 [Musa balbisiana]
MKETVVLYPVPGMGHLVPMVELAKLFVLHDFSVAVVLMHTPVKHPSVDPFVARVSSAYPSISFHQLPQAASLPDTPVTRFLDLVLPNNPQLLHFLAARSRTSDIRVVVLDFFCTDALAVTAKLRLPSYFFFASCAAAECVAWLDEQPRGSVVFLCFGSMGMFSAEQIKEIAAGLERSGQRFLWVVRAPRSESQGPQGWGPQSEPDLEALVPEGFLERTEQRGFLAKSWAPQVEVLNHEAVGGFVTHCGWNSVLEAITAGVPMIGWPLYAEQGMNKVLLVEQMRVAVAMEGCAKELVAAEEVEARIRWLMESEGGRELRERAVATKQRAAAARREAGSSHQALLDVVKTLRNASTSPLPTTGLTSEDHLKMP